MTRPKESLEAGRVCDEEADKHEDEDEEDDEDEDDVGGM